MADCDPMLILIKREKYQCLWRTFYELELEDQRVVDLWVFDNMKYWEIGEGMKITRKEALRRCGRAIVELRERFLRYNRGDT